MLILFTGIGGLVDVGCDMASYQQLSGPQQRNGNNYDINVMRVVQKVWSLTQLAMTPNKATQ